MYLSIKKLILMSFIMTSIFLMSCSKEDEDEPSCNETNVTFKVKCSNCSLSKPLNVTISPDGNISFSAGSVLISSTDLYEIPIVTSYSAIRYKVTTKITSNSASLVQASGSLTLNVCQTNSVSINVAY